MSKPEVRELVWKATDQQGIALKSVAKFTLFGGSRGGGKSDASIHWLLKRHKNPNMLGVVMRRNAKDLIEFISRAHKVFKLHGAKKTGSPQSGGVKFVFPSGAEIYTGHLASEDAYEAFQGWNITDLLIEELTHIPTLALFQKIASSLRSTDPTLTPRFFATTNPTNAGFEWVKEFWHIDTVPSGTYMNDDGVTKLFVQAGIYDNPHLMEADPDYVKYLESLPLELRKRWLEGSWEEIDTENQYYASRIKKLKALGQITKVPIEAGLRTFTAFDLGISDQMVLWTFQLHGKELRIIDCFADRNQPLKYYSDYLYALRDEYGIKIDTVFVPHDANVRSMTSDTLMTRYEKLVNLGHNVDMVPSIGVDDGIDAVREILSSCWIDEKRCHDGIRALRAYQREFDEKMNRYKDVPLHDWASDYADSFRYLALSLPLIGTGIVSPIMELQKENFRKRIPKRRRR